MSSAFNPKLTDFVLPVPRVLRLANGFITFAGLTDTDPNSFGGATATVLTSRTLVNVAGAGFLRGLFIRQRAASVAQTVTLNIFLDGNLAQTLACSVSAVVTQTHPILVGGLPVVGNVLYPLPCDTGIYFSRSLLITQTAPGNDVNTNIHWNVSEC